MSAPYQALRCSDGYITIGAANDRLFARLCQLLGHTEWIDDPAYGSNADRVKNHDTLATRIETVTTRAAAAHWLELLELNGIPCGPINSYADVMADPHIAARDMVLETLHPTLGRIRTLGTPLKMSQTPLTPGRAAPLLGEHTDEVLAEIGFDPASVGRLRNSGVVE